MPRLETPRAVRSCAILSAVLSAVLLISPARAAEPAIEFMKQVSRDLIAAARSGSQQAFADAIQKYGHVPAIGLYALGEYKPQLQPAERNTYYSGMVRFLARYAAAEAPKYGVSHAEVLSPPVRDDKGLFVDTRIHLKSGTSYDVRWMLVPHGSGFRVRDAQVLGFWISPFLKKLFEDYIGENGGRVGALVTALSR
jgi:phospholipid transport system substrate-binding protein